MQKVENSEVSFDFSKMTLDELKAYRDTLRENIAKKGNADIKSICILRCKLLDINHAIIIRGLYTQKHHADN